MPEVDTTPSRSDDHQKIGGHPKAVIALVCVAIFALPAVDGRGFGPIVLSGLLAIALLFWPSPARSKPPRAFTFAVCCYALAVGLGILVGADNANFRYDVWLLAVVPGLAYAMGRRLDSPGARAFLLRTLVLLGTVAAGLAIFEYVTEQYVLSNVTFFDTPLRRGHLRARSIFPQSLVLAFVSALCIPFAFSQRIIRGHFVRLLVLITLTGGSFASGSRSAIPILILSVVICGAFTLTDRYQRSALVATGLLLAAIVYWPEITGFFARDTTYVTSGDPDVASAQFRAELYRNLPTLVAERPFGTGLGAIPEGYLEFRTSFGIVDASRTVDSEYVLSAIKLGVLGLLVWFGLAVHHVQRLRVRVSAVDVALTLCLIFGFFLALQAWLTIVALIGLLLGLQAAEHASIQKTKMVDSRATAAKAR